MKKIYLTIVLMSEIAFTALAGASIVIDDFESGKINGWGGYKDAKSLAPVLTLSDDAISGDTSLKIEFKGCRQYQGIHYFKLSKLPGKAVVLSFLLKASSGVPPVALALTECSSRYGKRIDYAAVRSLNVHGKDWQKIVVKLKEMKYGSGPNKGKMVKFNEGAIYTLRFYGPVTNMPSVFLIDDLAWEIE